MPTLIVVLDFDKEPDIAEWTEADTQKIINEFLESSRTKQNETPKLDEAKPAKLLKVTVAK